MSPIPGLVLYKFAIAVAISAVIAVPVFAQDAEQEPADDVAEDAAETAETTEMEEMEEIIVVSPRPGSRRRVDADYQDPARAKLLKDFYRMRELEEEYEWRKSAATDSSSRIKWGYDPRDEYRMRNDTDMQDLHWEKDKPATMFRVEF